MSAAKAQTNPELVLPSPPQALASIVQEASKPNPSVPVLSSLCSNDPGFAVELLRLVNSPVYSRGAKISSVARAVAVLGSRSLRNMALCTAARSCADAKKLKGFALDQFWENSLRRAVSAQLLAERCPDATMDPAEMFTAGLLQDLGVLALVQTHPEHAAAWMEHAESDPEERRTFEMSVFGVSHDQVAKVLAQAWELPADLAMPMLHHHDLSAAPPEHELRCRLVAGAEALSAVLACADKKAALERARVTLSELLAVTPPEVDELVGELAQRVESVASALGITVGTQPTLESILQAANMGLVAMNTSYEDIVRQLEETIAEKEALAAKLEEQNKALEQLSITDTLTGLPNRRAFSGRLHYEISRTGRAGGHLILLIGDVDKFKLVNDTWGHEYGDTVLKEVSNTIANAVRQTDLVARIGGEEFAILLPATDREGGLVAAKKILVALRENVLRTPTGETRPFTISLGLAALEGPTREAHDAEEVGVRLYKTADAALYASKKGGRDKVTEVREAIGWQPRKKAKSA